MFSKALVIVGLLITGNAFAIERGCKNGAPVAQRTQVAPYTLKIVTPLTMDQNKSNKNYNKYIYNGRAGGCILFSKEAVIPAGEYSTEQTYAIYTQCDNKDKKSNGKLAYAFVKFNGEGKQDILRLQCYNAKSEQQLDKEDVQKSTGSVTTSERFAPSAQQAQAVLSTRAKGVNIRVVAK